MSRGYGKIQRKLMIFLLGTTSMAFTYSPFKQYEILREMKKELGSSNEESLKKSLDSLFKSDLVLKKIDKNGDVVFSLTEKGFNSAKEHLLGGLVIKKNQKWDKKWRIVMFDIPEELRSVRGAIRYRLKKMGFVELQKSVFVHPFDCFDVISKIADFYKAEEFVYFMVVESINKESEIKNHFKL